MFTFLHEMIIVETCFFGCSLKTCAFVYLVLYSIVSAYRFANGLLKFNEFPVWVSLILELRHVIWSSYLYSAIREMYASDKVSYLALAPCLWMLAVDLAETIIDYFGFIFTKRVIIPSFGNSKKQFDHNYALLIIVFPFFVAPFVYLWIVVYSCYHKEFLPERIQLSEILDLPDYYNVPYSMYF